MGQKRSTAAVPRLGAHKNNLSGGASKDGCLNPSTRPHGRVLGPRFTTYGRQERPTFTHRSAGEASPTLKAPTTATSSRPDGPLQPEASQPRRPFPRPRIHRRTPTSRKTSTATPNRVMAARHSATASTVRTQRLVDPMDRNSGRERGRPIAGEHESGPDPD